MKSGKYFGSSVVLEDVSWQGLGNCASTSFISSQNYQPVLRNPVDLINATYGQLLSYVVPEVNNLFVHIIPMLLIIYYSYSIILFLFVLFYILFIKLLNFNF